MKRVLFLCTANYYRSRFAEIYFNHLAQRERLPWRADSRGLMAEWMRNLGPISSCTVRGLAELGIHLDGDIRDPRPLTERDLEAADLTVAVKAAEHRAMMAAQFPEWAEAIQYWHIDDLDCAEPEEALPQLQCEIERLVARLKSGVAADRPQVVGPADILPPRKEGVLSEADR